MSTFIRNYPGFDNIKAVPVKLSGYDPSCFICPYAPGRPVTDRQNSGGKFFVHDVYALKILFFFLCSGYYFV